MKNIILFSCLSLFSINVFADSRSFNLPEKYVSECGSCHVAYPAELMPWSNWQRLTISLDKHYGTDATVDPKTLIDISKYLQTSASYRKGADTQDNRITSANWFKREHSESTLPKGQKFSNCAACHKAADSGNFSLRGYKGSRDED